MRDLKFITADIESTRNRTKELPAEIEEAEKVVKEKERALQKAQQDLEEAKKHLSFIQSFQFVQEEKLCHLLEDYYDIVSTQTLRSV